MLVFEGVFFCAILPSLDSLHRQEMCESEGVRQQKSLTRIKRVSDRKMVCFNHETRETDLNAKCGESHIIYINIHQLVPVVPVCHFGK